MKWPTVATAVQVKQGAEIKTQGAGMEAHFRFDIGDGLNLNLLIHLSIWTVFPHPINICKDSHQLFLHLWVFSWQKKKKSRVRETWKIKRRCSQSYFPLLLPFDTFYLIAFRPRLILSGLRPMLICMAILYTGQMHEDSRLAWIHRPTHIHQVALSSMYSLQKNGG